SRREQLPLRQLTFARAARRYRSITRIIVARRGDERRPGTVAVAIGVGIVGRTLVVRIGDAGQKTPRGRRHALAVAVEGAIAQARIFVALKAEWMAGSDGLRRQAAQNRKASSSQNRDDDIAHEGLLGVSRGFTVLSYHNRR